MTAAPGDIPKPPRPTLALLVKLASIASHVEEAIGPVPSPLDLQAAAILTRDPEVTAWMNAADHHALRPVPRS